MSKNTDTVKLNWHGVEYTVATNVISGKFGYCMPTSAVATVIRKVLAEMRRSAVISYDRMWVRSEMFAGGDAVDVWVETDCQKSFEFIQEFVTFFRAGHFDPMTDYFNYKEDSPAILLENGTSVACDAKYTSTHRGRPYFAKN